MNRLIRHAALVIGAVALIACESKPETDTTTATPTVAAPLPAPVPDEQIATAADFEATAAEEITEENAEVELAKLEKEVSEE